MEPDYEIRREQLRLTAGGEPVKVAPVSGGLSASDKFKVRVDGTDWMAKFTPGTPLRLRWYQELEDRSSEQMANAKRFRLFEDGTLCLLSPWIEGESLQDRLRTAGPEMLPLYGQQAAEILLQLHRVPFDYPGYAQQLRQRVASACAQSRELDLSFPHREEICKYLEKETARYETGHLCFVHKDIRPENFIVREDRLYLIDFDNGGLGEPATDFSYLTTMGGTEQFPFAGEVLKAYLSQVDNGDFWEKNLFYSTLQVLEYGIWKFRSRGRQMRLQAENLWEQYAGLTECVPAWMRNTD